MCSYWTALRRFVGSCEGRNNKTRTRESTVWLPAGTHRYWYVADSKS